MLHLNRMLLRTAAVVVPWSISTSYCEPETTKKWYFYNGKMDQDRLESIRLFKCNNTPLADDVARYLGTNIGAMKIGQFADGETSIKVEEGVRGKHVYVVCSTTDVDRLMELLLSISTMRRASAGKITAIIPYYGYGRQDQGQTVAAADVARMLQIMDVDHVITVDLHSSQIEGFFSPNVTVDNLPAVPIAAMYLAEEQWVRPIVIAPHAHTVAMAQLFRRHMATEDADIGMGMVIKQHLLDPLKPGELVGNVHGCDCIIVDKLVDTAKTLLDTARLLKDHGARSVTAFCVHGRFSSDAIEKIGGCEDLDRLIITDTITPTRELEEYREKGGEKIETLTIAPMLAETMSRIHKKSSVSELQA